MGTPWVDELYNDYVDLQEGDHVLWYNAARVGTDGQVVKVKKVTKRLLILSNGMRVRRSDGREPGNDMSWQKGCIDTISPEQVAERARSKRQASVEKFIKLNALPPEVLEQVYNVLNTNLQAVTDYNNKSA